MVTESSKWSQNSIFDFIDVGEWCWWPIILKSNHIKGWQWCWWQRYIGDFMMVTDLRCCWQNHYVGDFFRYVGDLLNVLNRSQTSKIGHQHLKLVTTFVLQHIWRHIWSPTSVINIDVTSQNCHHHKVINTTMSPTSLNSSCISLLDDACNIKMIIPLRPRRYDFINEPKL